MLNIHKKLPHLDPLVAFEASARHSSFAKAALELNVTAPAISQQIRNLEAGLGVALFNRGHRSVQLTSRGKLFQSSVSVALAHLANAVDEVRIEDDLGELSVATDTSIASIWLLPRLHRFEARFPHCSIRLTASDIQTTLLSGDFQIGVVHGHGDWVGHESHLLFDEEVFPVCSPEYLSHRSTQLTWENLPKAELLDLEFEQWNWMNWAIWLAEVGLPLPEVRRKMKSNNYPLILDAARKGGGVALGWRHLVDGDLADGTLVRPFSEAVRTQNGYHLLWPYNDELSPLAVAFRDWCIEEVETPIPSD